MIEVDFDHQIFSLQRFGGATRYFMNLINELLRDPEVSIRLQLGIHDERYILQSIYSLVRGIPGNGLMPNHGIMRYVMNELLMRWYGLMSPENQGPLIHHCTYIYPVHLRPRVPLVVTHHDCTLEKFKDQFRRAELTIRMKKRIYRQANQIITISRHSKIDLMDYYGIPEHKIHVIHHGVEPPLPRASCRKPVSAESDPYLLYVGARTPYKNFNGLLRAFSVSRARKDFKLVAVGGGRFSDAELALIKELKIQKNIITLPGVSQAELAWLYYNAHGMIYPSTYEGFGFPPLEAMSMECPTLVSNSSCLPEILGGGPLYFESGDDEDLAKQLDILCYDQSLRDSIIKRGREVAARYTWEVTARKTRAVYEMALG